MRTEPYLVLAAQAANQAARAPAHARAEPLVAPISDPFYDPSSKAGDISGYRSGQILYHREIELPNYKNVKKAYQLAYRSSNTDGNPMAGITTVIVPVNNNKRHVVSYQLPENAAWLNCAPSWEILQGDAEPEIQTLLDNGWIVNAPDYEGLNSAYLTGRLGGKLTLDSMRAVGYIGNMTETWYPQFAMWGYSGGSIATGWAAEMQPEYAPDLNVKGAAIGGYVVDLKATALSVNKGPLAGLLPAGLVGLSNEYVLMANGLMTELKEDKVAELDKARSQCSKDNIAQYAGQDIFDYFTRGEDALKNNDIDWTLATVKPGQTAPKVPLLVYQGLKDEVVPHQGVTKLVDFYCAGGTPVHYVQGENYDHTQMALGYSASAIHWISEVFDFKANSTCTYENITRDTSNDPPKPNPKPPTTPDPVTPDPVTPDPKPPTTPDPVTPDPVTPDPKPPTTPDPVNPNPNTPNPNTPGNPNTPITPGNPNTPITPGNPNTPGSVSTPGSGSSPTSSRTTSTPISTASAVTTAPNLANLATTERASLLLISVLTLLALIF